MYNTPQHSLTDRWLNVLIDSPVTLRAHTITAAAKSMPLSLQNAQNKTFTIENPNIAGSHLGGCIAHARHKSHAS